MVSTSGPMNHARGALKSSIQRWVWKKAEQVLKHGERECVCGYWPTAVGKYLAALVRTGAYPLETAFPKYSVEDMLALLDCFHHPFEGGCAFCAVDWTVQVNCAINLTANHFDGLCLDCMEASRPKHGDVDADYWQQLGSINGR
ncbi:hypothetical protein BS50DRAFT_569809 [Corynespora cassiicola Philippines]|uniref:Uncharacterized protein n=1 Tax=Corynespora cassiicola Philippines TaxID=1448308 RepID=A0A2T2P3T0_CORCC|nr:hypothetical protein BS50DRAFT_569809 [Corynespora cassiicola Philippines]